MDEHNGSVELNSSVWHPPNVGATVSNGCRKYGSTGVESHQRRRGKNGRRAHGCRRDGWCWWGWDQFWFGSIVITSCRSEFIWTALLWRLKNWWWTGGGGFDGLKMWSCGLYAQCAYMVDGFDQVAVGWGGRGWISEGRQRKAKLPQRWISETISLKLLTNCSRNWKPPQVDAENEVWNMFRPRNAFVTTAFILKS